MGFKRDIEKITSYLPKQSQPSDGSSLGLIQRQTLLFSATFSDEVKAIAVSILKQGFKVIDTVGDEKEQTHSHVPQKLLAVPIQKQIQALYLLLTEHMKQNPKFKIMVFFPTARQTAYTAQLFGSVGLKVSESECKSYYYNFRYY